MAPGSGGAVVEGHVVRDDRFFAMGNTTHVVVLATNDDQAEELLARARNFAVTLERSWSRFVPTSDVARLNTARGRAVRISPDTEVLIRHLVAAFDATDGLFNPFVLPALVNAGYRASLAGDGTKACEVDVALSMPATSNVLLESVDGETWCRLLAGASIDPGGLGKGLAADIIAERLILEGARGVLVSMGGDVRCAGTSPHPDGWVIDIETLSHPALGNTTVVLKSGAIATSSTHAKRWHNGHHIIDPATSKPIDEGAPDALRLSSVLASTAVWAEVFATATLVAGASTAGLMLEARGLAGRFERVNGEPIHTRAFERYER